MGSMVEFKDIRITAALPLHPYLAKHPRLFIRLTVDGQVCGNTTEASGDLVSGVWDFDGRLQADVVKQSLAIVVLADAKGTGIQVVSATFGVAEFLARVNAFPNRYQEFDLFDSGTPFQLKLSMTCSVRFSTILGGVPQTIRDTGQWFSDLMGLSLRLFPDHQDHTIDMRTKNREAQSHREPDISENPSREGLESLYATLTRIPDNDERKAPALIRLARAYNALYQEGRVGNDLDKSISLHGEALQCSVPFQSKLADHAQQLSLVLMMRFQNTEIILDIERAISSLETALNFTEDLAAEKPERLGNLGSAFQLRFGRLGGLADLENAISNKQMAVKLTPDGHPDKPGRLSNLGNALKSRFNRLGDVTDLEDAISNKRRAVELTPDGDPDGPNRLSSLGNALETRFKRLGNATDLEDAISNKRRAVELTPDGDPDGPNHLSNLGNALETRFKRLGNVTDLEDAISSNRRAVELKPDSHPNKPDLLNNLGNALGTRFTRLGNLADLEDAISNRRRAVELTQDGHPNRPLRLNNLGIALKARFKRLGILSDLGDAILHNQEAVELTPDDHPDKGSLLNNLGNALGMRFDRLRNLADLEDAISIKRKAVDLTPDNHPDKPGLINNLGIALVTLFSHLGNLADLEDAISNMQKSIELTPDGHYEKAVLLNNLSTALQRRFERLNSLSDLEEAISNSRNAVELDPDSHPDKPRHQRNLGNALMARFNHLSILSDLESALSAFSTAATSPSGSAMDRFKAARAWAKHSEAASKSPLDAFGCAIDLLPRIAWLGLAVTDQHALLADVGGIVRDAVAAAIRYKDYEMAVVWAEQGRSIVWQNLLGLRSPIDKLRETHPKVADRLQDLARRLEGSVSSNVALVEIATASAGKASPNHSKLATQWDDLIDEIRRIPKFEGFLRAKSFSQLAPAADEGPVVILNVNDSQCDALVLIADKSSERLVSAINIPLERFSHKTSKNMFQTLMELLSSAGVRERNDRKTGRKQSPAESDAKFKAILNVLWNDVVEPVIKGLEFQTNSSRPPRIWWCATGLLAFLPIHAAGLYDAEGVGDKASDYVVSSYTPTLTAILDSSDPIVQEDFQVLTVAQPYVPWARHVESIPKTEDEVLIVQSLTANARVLNLTREKATVAGVKEGMMKSNWIHLACHGQQNPTDPMKSGFLLHDSTLELSEIVRMSLPKADFAFLSACQTAMGDEKVAEESVHLAAGMFLSGCRGVIATTWSIRDDDAPMIAREVYTRMFKDGKPNRKEAAYALHEAVKVLRDSGAQCVSWVPFIHIGR